jgi:UDPglucose 6-dehydrogenase
MVRMRVGVYGAGYVGIVAAAAFASDRCNVVLTDISKKKIQTLKGGRIPFHEPGLLQLVQDAVRAGNLDFTDSPEYVAATCSIHILTVGTPAQSNGASDESQLISAAQTIGRNVTGDSVIVIKSTAPIGAHRRVLTECQNALHLRGVSHKVAVTVSPEFLRAGSAVTDFLNPDRVVIGGSDRASVEVVQSLYEPFTPVDKFIITDQDTATLIKYAANAMLATRISFMNELAHLAEKIGSNIDDVRRGIGSDPRIGPHYLSAGAGYGGSCLPKDISALLAAAESFSVPLRVIRATAEANDAQLHRVDEKLIHHLGDLTDKVIGIWGLAFKEGTDDTREAPSLSVIDNLLRYPVNIQVYDVKVRTNDVQQLDIEGRIRHCRSTIEAATGVDALLVMNGDQEYLNVALADIASVMRGDLLLDGRNCINPRSVRSAGLTYCGFGRGLC